MTQNKDKQKKQKQKNNNKKKDENLPFSSCQLPLSSLFASSLSSPIFIVSYLNMLELDKSLKYLNYQKKQKSRQYVGKISLD